jgi:hypothetical protein
MEKLTHWEIEQIRRESNCEWALYHGYKPQGFSFVMVRLPSRHIVCLSTDKLFTCLEGLALKQVSVLGVRV